MGVLHYRGHTTNLPANDYHLDRIVFSTMKPIGMVEQNNKEKLPTLPYSWESALVLNRWVAHHGPTKWTTSYLKCGIPY